MLLFRLGSIWFQHHLLLGFRTISLSRLEFIYYLYSLFCSIMSVVEFIYYINCAPYMRNRISLFFFDAPRVGTLNKKRTILKLVGHYNACFCCFIYATQLCKLMDTLHDSFLFVKFTYQNINGQQYIIYIIVLCCA